MAYDARIYRIFVAIPKDLCDEKKIIEKIINKWNKLYSQEQKTFLFPYYTSEVEKFYDNQYDIVLGAFWTKVEKKEGFSEGLEAFIKNGHPTSLFFSNKDIPRAKLDLDNLKKLEEFKNNLKKSGVIREYDNKDYFVEQLENSINRIVKDLRTIKKVYDNNVDNPDELKRIENKRRAGYYNYIGSIEDRSKELVGLIGDFINKSGEFTISLEKECEDEVGFGLSSLEKGRIFNKFNRALDNLVKSFKSTWTDFDEIFSNFIANVNLEEDCKVEVIQLISQLNAGLESAKGNLIPFSDNFENYNSNSMEFNVSAKILSNKLKNFDLLLDKSIEKIVNLKVTF